jgi:predicted signal transduction protein with EAL and GGDEF domain
MQVQKQNSIKMKSLSFWTIIVIGIATAISVATKKPEFLAIGICIGIIANFVLTRNTTND